MPTTDPLYPSTAPKRPGVPGDGFLGRQDFAKYVARILPTITEDSKVAFAAWVHSTPTRIDRTKWWMDAYPMVKKLNHWGRLLFTDKILADPLVRSEIDRLRLEDEQSGLMTQRQRRQKLKTIADTTEHPTRGFTDHIKAMELDAKLDGSLVRASEQSPNDQTPRAPALNLFFLNTAEVKPALPTSTSAPQSAINQLVIDVPSAAEAAEPDDLL